jgi:cytochrome c553
MSRLTALVLALCMVCARGAVQADQLGTTGNSKTWAAECSSCHLAFPPGLLVAKDWQRIMASLDKHFGSDASMTPSEATAVGAFLTKNASNNGVRHTSSVDLPKLTKTPWFDRKHRKIPDAAWADPRIRTASNCVACHAKAEQAQYSEKDISVPGYPGKHW